MQNNIENFEQVWNDSRFKILNLEIEDLTNILYSEKLKNESQQTVWQVIHDWVVVNKKDRLTHLPNLLKKNLQFDRLTKNFVEENIFKNVIFKLLPLNFQTDLKNFVNSVKFQDELINDSFNLPNLSPVINSSHQKLLCINIYNGYLEIYDQQYNNWHSSSLKLPVKQHHFQLALLGSMLYAFGGKDDYSVTNQMWSRDLSDLSSQWTARANMNQSRTDFSSVVFNDTIYALGGTGAKGFSLRSCERYDSQLNQWSTVADMNRKHVCASAAVINGYIYIAGDLDHRLVSKYCPETDTWREVAPMGTVRKNFALTPFAGFLWAIGGEDEDSHPLRSCESYNPVTGTWQWEKLMNKERWDHAAIEFNKKLYVVGGKRVKDTTEQNKTVEKYVPGEEWTETGQLKKIISNAKLIIVPSVYANYFS